MTNYENRRAEIEPITRMGRKVAIDKETNEICACGEIDCKKCLFEDFYRVCDRKALKWADAEYIEPEVDWSKVAVDTPILVSDDNEHWYRSYFADYQNEEQKVIAWKKGRTSWSVYYDNHFDVSNRELWNYAKLAEVEK